MLLKNTIFVWSQNPLPISDPILSPMVYASANADGSFAGYDSSTAAVQLNTLAPGKRVLIFQGMLSGLFNAPGDTPPFYANGIAACQRNVATFFTALRAAGVKKIDAVVPDAEGAEADWQINADVAQKILAAPQASTFLAAIQYTSDKSGTALSYFIQTHREQVEPILASYADQAILAASKPLADLYGNVMIQKGTLNVPSYVATLAPLPCDAGDTPSSASPCSFAQCEELYGACQPGYAWTAQKVADTWLTRVAAAKGSCGKPVVCWIAPRSYAGSASFLVPWNGTDIYNSFAASLLKMTNGNALYWRPSSATIADDEAIIAAAR